MTEAENEVAGREGAEGSRQDRGTPGLTTRQMIGWLSLATGTAGALVTATRTDRGPLDWTVSMVLVAAGLAELLEGRQTHIAEAEEAILEELQGLDPIARAQVLKTVVRRQLGRRPKPD